MPAPTIDTTTSVLGFRQGEGWQYQPATTNSPAPTSWAWTGLPPGVSANATTGKLTGPATAPGVFLARVTATNGDGTSTPVVVTIGIYGASYLDDGAVPINWDIRTNRVYPHGVAEWQPGQAVIYAKSGDDVLLDIGFTADGGASFVPVGPALLKLGIKETDPQAALAVSPGIFETVGEWDQTRYRIIGTLTAASIRRALRSYESETGTYFDAYAELELQQVVSFDGESRTLIRSSQSFILRLVREIVPASS